MKHIYSFLFVWMIGLSAWAQSGNDYDPENPADPEVPPTPPVYYTLTMEAAPSYGGSVNNSQLNVEADHEVYCRAYEKTGYRFKQWMVGDSLVSTEASFYFKMPAEDVVLIAYFDYVGYDPENPADPEAPGDDPVAEKSYNVTVYATPSVGGYFNSSSFWLKEGEEANVYAYPQNGYRFVSWKQNGVIISTDNPLRVVMDTLNLAYTATFVYDPMSPDNPGSNNFNPATGEVVIDKFSAGNLNSTLSNTIGGSENYSLVQSIVIVGRMNSYDFGFSHNFNNCSLIDLSRTTGYTEIPSWGFEGMSSLTKLLLPSTVERIGNGAFNGCSNLSELICYAAVPPALDPNAFASSVGLVVRVPLSAMSLYQAADGWKELAILPLDEDTYQLNVSLPADAADGRYKNMTLELNNISSGQTLRYIITDRTTYAFANLISGTKYNVLVKNASNAVLGTIFDIKVDKADVNVAFESLLQPQNVVVRLLTPDNVDVSSQATIKWYDEEKRYLSQGIELKGILEDSKINYQVTLSNDLAMQYVAPQDAEYIVRSSDNTIVMTLMPFEEVLLTGRVNNATTGTGVYNAAVTFSQTLNGKYTKSVVAKTDTAGVFSATIYNVACDVVVAAYDYISQTLHFDDLSNVEALNGIQLQEITGVRISTAFTYKGSIAEDEVANVQDGYDGQANVSYTIYNKTTQKTINDFNVQSPYIVLLEEVSEGDVLSITAKSRTNAFKDVTADGVVDANNRVEVTFPIVEWGKLQASYNQSASNRVVGILYNAKGELQNKFSYSDSKLTIEGLQDGTYTLVTMEGSDFFNSILNLSELSNAGLIEGTHYVKHDVTIQTGKITSLSINNVPEFDDSQFYYTGNNTQFTVNKQSVTVGNYVTLRAKVDFKNKYADKVSNVKLVVDYPESCDFVDNSVMVGAGISNYSVEKNRVIVDLANMDDVVRFCVIPSEGGCCSPNAFVQFTLDGKEIHQPIGTVSFEAENLKLICPDGIIAQKEIVIGGIAPSNSDIYLYDKSIMVAQTKSYANGKWEIKYDIANGKLYNLHKIYAEIIDSNGLKMRSDAQTIIYNENAMSVKSVTMVNGGNSIVFDFVNASTKDMSYSYNPSDTEFLFLVDFTKNNDPLLDNVGVNVEMSNGEIIELYADYSDYKDKWIAYGKFKSSLMPVNVSVTYDHTDISVIENKDVYNDFLMSTLESMEFSKIDRTGDGFTIYNIIDYYAGDETSFSTYRCPIVNRETIESHLTSNGWVSEINTDSCCYYVREDNQWIAMAIARDSIFLFSSNNLKNVLYKYNLHQNEGIHRVTFVDRDRGIYTMGENALDRFIRGRLGGLFDLANCKITCEANQDLIEYPRLEQAVRHLVGWQGVKLAFASASTCQFLSDASGIGERPTRLLDVYEQVDDALSLGEGRLEGLETYEAILNYDNELVKTIMEFPDYCKCQDSDNSTQYSIVRRNVVDSRNTQCRKGKNKKDSPKAKEPIIDPSGYVYEGVSSNRVEGVMASCFYKETVEDMYGDLHENVVLWDAEQYAQENPLFTDENGMYRWDVPQGLWQVKFEKEGYETTYSEWLPVPPPQLEVNIPIVQNKQPEVAIVHAYEDGIVVEFDKYMQPATLNTSNIFVVQNGEKVDGTVVMLNEEIAYRDSSVVYASKVRFVFDQPITAEELTLTVSNRVKSYAGVQMQDTYTQTFDIEKEIKAIVADSLVSVFYGSEHTLAVKVTPADAAAGKTLVVTSFSPMILAVVNDSITLDSNGEAMVTVRGELPGSGAINYSIAGYDYTATTIVKVEYDNTEMTANPTASIPSGTTVTKGTEVTLSCATEGAVIYYTLDGSCPCDEATQIRYDGTPIIINSNTELRMMAVAEGRYESDVVVYYYYVEGDVQMTANPTASIASGTTVAKGTEVTLSCATEGAVIYYTLDGSSPDDAATQIRYDGTPIVINETTTLRMMAVAEGYEKSYIVEYHYYVEEEVKVTAAPTASIASGTTVAKGTEVTLNCATEGAVIYYTLDGSSPDDVATQIRYDGTPIVINETTTLRMLAVADGFEKSSIVEYRYYVEEEVKPMEVTIHQKWDDVLICDNSSNEFVAYQWYKNDMPIAGETRQYYSEVDGLNGSYYVMAQNAAGDWGMSNVVVCAGRAEGALKVTPSIVKKNEKCVVSIHRAEGNEEVVYLNVYNAMGQMVRRLEMTGSSVELELGNPGPYFIKAVGLKNNVESEKIMVIE